MNRKGWMTIVAGLLACGLIAAGCGDDDESSDTGTDVTSSIATEATEAAGSIEDEASESASEAIDNAQSEGKKACEDTANQLSGDQKQQALQQCEQIFGDG